jgi:hypothetical protein
MSSIAASSSASSTFSLTLACHGNNEAVRFLELGDFGRAKGILANALRVVVHAMKHMNPLPETGQEHIPAGRGSCVQSEPSSQLLLNRSATSTFDGHPCSNYQGFLEPPLDEKYMYTHAWRMTGVDNDCAITAETVNEVSMILVFNLALTFHVKALSLIAGNTIVHSQVAEGAVSTILRSTATLQKANSLYEKAYCLLVNGNKNSCVNTTRAMAILNNLALTYRGLNSRTEAEKCWRLLLSVLVHVNNAALPRMNTSDHDESLSAFGFLGNVIYLLLGNKDNASSSPAPAA